MRSASRFLFCYTSATNCRSDQKTDDDLRDMRARALHAADAAKLLHQLCITEVVVVVVVVCANSVCLQSHWLCCDDVGRDK